MILRSVKPLFLLLALWCAACSAQSTQISPTSRGGTQVAISTTTSTVPPSPIPASPTLSPTPPPAQREFTEAFDATPAYWDFLQVDSGSPFMDPSTRDGFLVFDLPAPDQWAYALYGGQDYTDVTVETEMQARTAGDGAAGIVCRYDEKKGWYEFNIYADQTYQLLFGQWLAPGVARYTPLYHGESAAITGDTNDIELECQGTSLTPFINGLQMRKWPEQRYGLQEGQAGLTASSFADAPFTIAFDWVKVSEP